MKHLFPLIRIILLPCLLLSILTLSPTYPARAATITVTNTADSGPGSLRDAIANAAPNDTIHFDTGLAGEIIHLASQLTIDKNLTIDGSGLSPQLIISGDTNNDGMGDVRVFYVNSGITSNLINLTVSRGYADKGGGIYNTGASLTITNNIFSNNNTPIQGIGGGIGGAIYSDGNLITITNSVFIDNEAYRGGGIYSNSSLTIANSNFSSNAAHDASPSGGFGGAIANSGTLTVVNSTFSHNYAGNGGSISNGGTLTVTNSTFSSNGAGNGGGGGILNSGPMTLTNSTFSGNSAYSILGRSGGAIYSSYTGALIINSTISGNSSDSGAGGGIFGNPTLSNTIVSNNIGGNCEINYTHITDGGGNLTWGDTTCLGIKNADPKLSALGDYGGPTQTFALLPGSAAIDAGDDATCAAAPVNNLDQRGVARPQGAHCDIGAYELVDKPIVTLSNTIASLPETTDTSSAIKVADITVTDDTPGTNVLSLSGADANQFSITDSSLYLNAGTTLNANLNPTLDVTVNVDDASIGTTPDDSKSVSIIVTHVNTRLGKNGGFETYTGTSKVPTSWKASKFETLDGKNAIHKSGKFSVKIAGTEAVKTLTQTLTGLTGSGGDVITFSFWVRGSSVPKTGKCMGQVSLYNGTTLVKARTVTCPTGTYAFRQKIITFDVSSAYNKAVIKFTVQKSSGTIWFDAVSLLK